MEADDDKYFVTDSGNIRWYSDIQSRFKLSTSLYVFGALGISILATIAE